jgi:hypothetical protein
MRIQWLVFVLIILGTSQTNSQGDQQNCSLNMKVEALHANTASQDPTLDPKDSTSTVSIYVGLSFPYNTIFGDFRGTKTLEFTRGDNEAAVVLLPKIKSSFGWEMLLGARSQAFSVELTYVESDHETDQAYDLYDNLVYPLERGESSFHTISVNALIHPQRHGEIQAYAQIGIGYPWLTIHNGMLIGKTEVLAGRATPDTTYYVTDETFSPVGLSYNFGAGLAYHLHPRLSLVGDFVVQYSPSYHVKHDDFESGEIHANFLGFIFRLGVRVSIFELD